MRASDHIDRGTVPSDGEVENDNEPPVFDQGWNSIDQAFEKRQERKLDRHHGYPCKYKASSHQLAKLKNPVEIRRLGCEECWCVCESFGQVHVVHVDIQDRHRGNEAGGAKCQEAIVEGKFLLNDDSDVVTGTYTD